VNTQHTKVGEYVLKLHFILFENLLCTQMVHNNHQIDPMMIELCNLKKCLPHGMVVGVVLVFSMMCWCSIVCMGFGLSSIWDFITLFKHALQA